MSEPASRPRPQFHNINIFQILTYRLPPAAKTSILHRVSGVLLFLALPLVLVPIFALSITSPQSYASMAQWVSHPVSKLILLVLIWAYMHHFCAGIRYLTLDMHIGNDRESSQRSGAIVLGVSLALTLVFALKLFGAW